MRSCCAQLNLISSIYGCIHNKGINKIYLPRILNTCSKKVIQ